MMWCSEDLQLWHASLQWVMEDLQWCDASLWMSEVMRTYNGGAPHSLLGGGRGGHHQLHLLHRPQCGTTLPNSSLDSCLPWTSNIVQASLAVPPLKNLHLRCSQMAALEVGWVHTVVLMQETMLGGVGLSPAGSHSSAVIFRCGSWTGLR